MPAANIEMKFEGDPKRAEVGVIHCRDELSMEIHKASSRSTKGRSFDIPKGEHIVFVSDVMGGVLERKNSDGEVYSAGLDFVVLQYPEDFGRPTPTTIFEYYYEDEDDVEDEDEYSVVFGGPRYAKDGAYGAGEGSAFLSGDEVKLKFVKRCTDDFVKRFNRDESIPEETAFAICRVVQATTTCVTLDVTVEDLERYAS